MKFIRPPGLNGRNGRQNNRYTHNYPYITSGLGSRGMGTMQNADVGRNSALSIFFPTCLPFPRSLCLVSVYDEPQLTLWTRPWTVKFRFWRVEGRDEGPSKPVRRELSSSDPRGPTGAQIELSVIAHRRSTLRQHPLVLQYSLEYLGRARRNTNGVPRSTSGSRGQGKRRNRH